MPSNPAELINKISEKTVAGKIRWLTAPNGYIALIPGRKAVKVHFVHASGPMLLTKGWAILTIRLKEAEKEREIVKIENNPSGLLSAPELHAAANNLYRTVSNREQDDIKEAIDEIDQL